MAAMSGAWLRKKVRHPWLGGARRLTMYLATLDCAISNPSLSSSPWMRGAPQSGFSTLIRFVGVYDLHEYGDEKREALEKWAQRLASIFKSDSAAPAKVIKLRGRRR
jgi:hypothetical protein